MSDSTFNFNLFIQESRDVLMTPRAYFSSMKTTGGIAEPLIKALIYGIAAGIIAMIWSLLKIGAMGGGLFGGAVGISLLFFYIIMAVVGLFLGAVILLVISAICKGSTDFEANVRVTASVMVIMPIKALLGFITGLNLTAGIIVGLIISLFSLYLLYHGLVEALKSKKETTRILIYILVAIFVLFMLIGFGARNRTRKLMNEFNNTDFKELLKEEYSD